MTLDPETLLQAYSQGAFPMTDRDGQTRWYTADPRGILPLEKFHIPRTLRQVVGDVVETIVMIEILETRRLKLEHRPF